MSKRLTRRHWQHGFTIVEIMVSLAIGMLVSALVVTIFSASARTYRVASSVGDLQETGRVAMEAIERDARNSGFRGCNSNNVGNSAPWTNVVAAAVPYLDDFSANLRGYNATAGWSPALPTQVSGAVPAPIAGTDVVVFRVVTGTPIALSASMASVNADVPLMSAGNFLINDRVLLADCSRTSIFKVSAVIGTTLQHDAIKNTTPSLGRAYGEDAIVMPIQTRAYYIGASSRNPATERSLWVRTDTGASQELVENVVDLQIQYGEDTNGDFVADRFRLADTIGTWNNVVALQVSLLLRGSRDNETQQITTIVYNGATVTPTDKRLRRAYTATVQLRNKTL